MEINEQSGGAELLSATRLLETAFKRLKERFKIVLKVVAVFVLLVVPYLFSIHLSPSPGLSILSIILGSLFGLWSVIAGIALIYVFGKDEELGFLEYLKLGLNKFWPYLWVAVIYNFVVLGGYILLVVPGILFGVWFSMAFYVLILENRKGVEALVRSRELLRGKFWAVVWRFIFLSLAVLVILLPFIIIDSLVGRDLSWLTRVVSLIVIPIGAAYHTAFFKNLVQVKKEPFVYDKKSGRKFIIAGLVGILLLVSLVSFGGYYYFTKLKPLMYQDDQSDQIITQNTEPEILNIGDYTVKYIATDNNLPDTLRFRFYGPARLQGYDFNGNLVTADTVFQNCSGWCSDNTKLRFDIIRQGGDPFVDKSLVSMPLDSIYAEYQEYVSRGSEGGFLSSVITVKLPIPPQDNFSKFNGYNPWVGVVYNDNDGDDLYDVANEGIIFTDGMMYAWQEGGNMDNIYVLGWNFSLSIDTEKAAAKRTEVKDDPVKNFAYRKSFENQIFHIPILSLNPGIFLFPVPLAGP